MKPNKQIESFLVIGKKLLVALLAAGMAVGSANVSALTAQGTMTVTATLTRACSVSASTLAFGSIAVTGDTASTLEIACTNGTTAPVIYSTTTRTMTDGGTGTLPFFLSQTSGAAADDDLANTSTGETIGSGWTADGTAHVVTIYGRIPTSSFLGQPVGSYSATIVISVDYS